jgi:hypothetical protein
MSNVTISKPENATSIIITSKNNPEMGAIMLRTNAFSLNEQGFMSEQKRVGWFKGKVEQLESFVKQYGLKEGMNFPMPVRLIVKEQTEAFYPSQAPKINPTTAEVVMSGGQPVYRNTFVVAESSQEHDVLLPSDKVGVTSKATTTTFAEANK